MAADQGDGYSGSGGAGGGQYLSGGTLFNPFSTLASFPFFTLSPCLSAIKPARAGSLTCFPGDDYNSTPIADKYMDRGGDGLNEQQYNSRGGSGQYDNSGNNIQQDISDRS